jgi:hypothetical protein
LPNWRKLSKIDVNSSSLAEMCDVIPQLIAAGSTHIVLFLHSFSFIRWKKDYSGFAPNRRALTRFERLLQYIHGLGYQGSFCTMQELAGHLETEDQAVADFIPTLKSRYILNRAYQRLVE